ncbi:MAG: dTMP kinase [Alphaproteobacteria bacterium]
MACGRFISIEGGEGAGKSTQAERLCAALRNRGFDVVATREPGGSPGAEDIRRLLVSGATDRWDATTEVLLHFAARRDHLVKTVLPALARGAWVVSDRFADSTTAYQGYAYGLGVEPVEKLHEMVVGEHSPDLTLILDLPVDLGLARARERGGDNRYERMDAGFHERLRQGFLAIARDEPARCVVIDASADADAVHAAILAAVEERLRVDGNG